MRIIGLDIHCAFAEAVAWDEGELARLGRVNMRRHLLEAFAKKLAKEDMDLVGDSGDQAAQEVRCCAAGPPQGRSSRA